MNRFEQYGDEDDLARDDLAASAGMIRAGIAGAAFFALALLSWGALASPGGEGNNTNCNGQGNPNSPCIPGTPGGNGGAGGAGGSARATAIAVALQRQAQQQRQAQRQNQSQTARGGSATVTNNITAGGGSGDGAAYSIPRDRLRVPDVAAPAIWSNNPCMVGASGGIGMQGFGLSFGAGIEDRDCTRRANAQHLVAMGETSAAREVMCGNAEVRAAFNRVGRPCVSDVPARPDAAGPVQQIALPAALPAPVAAPSGPPDWCATASPAERRRYAAVCGG